MKRFKSMVKRVLTLSLTVSLVLAVGCSSGTSSPAPAVDTTSQVPTTGGIVRTTINSDPDHLDPHLSAAVDTDTMMNNVFEGLIGFNATGEFIPRLASDYTVSEDGLIYTFFLRPGVTFHNGQPLTADDVIYSYTRLSGLGEEPALSSKFATVTSIEKVDEQTVKFVLSSPTSSFLTACTEAVIPADYTDQQTKPIGTGPFMFTSYTPGQQLVLDRNPNYYDESRMAKIDTVAFQIMSDPSSILLGLKSGDLDIAQIDSINVQVLENDFDIISFPQNMVQVLALNNKVAPFDDVRVRQAISLAVDQDLIISGVVDNFGSKVYSHGSPVLDFWYNDFGGNDPYPYDTTKSKALLTEAGYPNGFEATIKVPSNYPVHIDTAQVIADMLKQVGITLNIELIEWGQWLETVYTNADYEATIIALAGKLDPHDTYIRYTNGYEKNFYNYSNPAYDELINKASSESDFAIRAALYKQAQALLSQDAAAVYIMDPHLILASKPTLKGYVPYSSPYFDATTLYYTE